MLWASFDEKNLLSNLEEYPDVIDFALQCLLKLHDKYQEHDDS